MILALYTVIPVLVALMVAVAVATVRRLPESEEHTPSGPPELPPSDALPIEDDRTDDTEDVADELTEADSLITGVEDWPARFLEAAVIAGTTRDLAAFRVEQERFGALVPCPDEDLATILERGAADYLRELALEGERSEEALALMTTASLLEPGRADLHRHAAELALGLLRVERAEAELDLAGGSDRVGLARMLLLPADMELVPPGSGSALSPRRPKDLEQLLGLYHGRILARRRRLLARGVKSNARWLPDPPASWASGPVPEPYDLDQVAALRSVRAEWTGARTLCRAVGWADLEPSANFRPTGVQTVWLTELRQVAEALRSGDLEGRSWRGVELSRLDAGARSVALAEVEAMRAALEWLVREDAPVPFDERA